MTKCHGLYQDRTDVELSSYCNDLRKAFEGLCATKNITLEFQHGSLPHLALFDPNKIRRALDNLVSNAIKYSARFSKVIIKIDGIHGALNFTVIDEGQGIPQSELNKLFKEFGRTSTRPTENESSTGLGLSIVKRIVDLHNGQVFVESTVRKGSTFGFTLPLSPITVVVPQSDDNYPN